MPGASTDRHSIWFTRLDGKATDHETTSWDGYCVGVAESDIKQRLNSNVVEIALPLSSVSHGDREAFKRYVTSNNVTFTCRAEPYYRELNFLRNVVLTRPSCDMYVTTNLKEHQPIEADYYLGSDEYAQPVHASLFRVNKDGSRTLLASDVESGSFIVDVLAPLNVPYKYEAITYAESGVSNVSEYVHTLDTPYCFWYFGDRLARCRWGIESDIKLAKHDKKRVYYTGRKYPVSYGAKTHEEKRTCSGVLVDRREKDGFEALSEAGQAWYKAYDGDVVYVDCDDVSFSPDTYSRVLYGKVSVDMVRTDSAGVPIVQAFGVI